MIYSSLLSLQGESDDAHEKERPRDQISSASEKTSPKARPPPVDLYTTPANGKVVSYRIDQKCLGY